MARWVDVITPIPPSAEYAEQHSIGLLTPAWVDPRSQYRYYDWTQLDDAICISTLRSIDI